MSVTITDPLPASIEAEQTTLGSVLIDPACIVKADFLKPEHFTQQHHAWIWETMLANPNADYVLLANVLKQAGYLSKIGDVNAKGRAYLLYLQTQTLTSKRIVSYAREVYRISVLRKGIANATKQIELALKYDDPELNEFLDHYEELTSEVTSLNLDRKGPVNWKSINEAGIADIKNRWDNPDKAGIKTGYIDIDRAYGGLEKGGVYLWFGRTSMGKTEHAMNLAMSFSDRGDTPLYFSIEMPSIDMWRRLSQIRFGKPAGIFKNPREAFTEEQAYLDFLKELEQNKTRIIIDDTPGVTAAYVKNTATRLKRDAGVNVVVIDWLGLMKTYGKHGSEAAEYKAIAAAIKQAAREVNLPFIVTDQARKEIDKRKNKRPRIDDVMHGTEASYDGIIGVYRPVYYSPHANPNLTENILVKNRIGTGWIGTINLYRFPESGRLGNATKAKKQIP